ncbi:MAG TPA: acyl-CoA thioesterase [Clostridiaceae bacterium]|nr:acyl-CoA thioesterase [Clostridiaceae bacterium]
MTAITSFKVRRSEIDKMLIVHHSDYLKWFEIGRRDYLRKAGIPHSEINRLGFYLPISEIECKFKSPAKYGDEVAVITKITSISCVKVVFEYRILNKANGRTLAVGKTIHAWTDKNIKPLNIEKAAPQIYASLKAFEQK